MLIGQAQGDRSKTARPGRLKSELRKVGRVIIGFFDHASRSINRNSALLFVLGLHFPEPSPLLVLLSLSGVGILISLLPETKPVHGSRLCHQALSRIRQNTRVAFSMIRSTGSIAACSF